MQVRNSQRPSGDPERATVRKVFGATATAGAFFFAYGTVIPPLVRQWTSNDVYSHGFLVPLISLYLVWSRRRQLAKAHLEPSILPGGLLLAAGLLMLVIGHAGCNLILQEMSLPISLAGLLTVLYGRRCLALLWLPVCYLYFMIPLWSFVIEPLRPAYQNFSAMLSSNLMQLAGIPVHRSGIFLELPHVTLEVAPGCSGIYYLIAVIATGVPLAYLYLGTWTRRIVLVASGIAVATFFNGVRIAVIGILSFHGISSTLHGPGHVLQALSVSVAGYLVLFGGVLLLSRGKSPQESGITPPAGPRPQQDLRSRSEKIRTASRFWPAASLLAVAGLYLQFVTGSPAPLRQSFAFFPDHFGDWELERNESSFDGSAYIEPDVSLTRTYFSPSHGRVSIYIGYFEQQELRKKLINYRSAALGQHAETRRFDFGPAGAMKTNLLVSRSPEPSVQLFWYRIAGEMISGSRRASLKLAMNGLVRGNQSGSLVVISQSGADGPQAEQAVDSCVAFSREVLPLIDRFVL